MLTSVTISDDKTDWYLPDVPHITFVEGYRDDWPGCYNPKSLDRVQYLADRRNNGVKELLSCFPKTTDVLMVDSYYVGQSYAIKRLIQDYDSFGRNVILAGSTWFHNKYWPHSTAFWDSWTTPEGLDYRIGEKGYLRVKAAGGIMMFSVEAWKTHSFDASRFPEGSEINGFCENSQLPTWLDFNAKFLHPRPLSVWKMARIAQGKYRRKILGR